MESLYTQIQHIVSIRIFDKSQHNYYHYVDNVEKIKVYENWFFRLLNIYETGIKSEKGFTDGGLFGLRKIKSKIEIEEEGYLVDENNKVYYKPRVEIRFSNSESFSKYFDTMKELNMFLNPILTKNKELIKLIDNGGN